MERYRLNPNFNGAAAPPQKPNLFLSPTSQISLPPKPHLKDPPISPYLQPHRPNPSGGDHLRLSADDSELSIFNAERYFNEGHDSNETSKKLTPIAERRDLSPVSLLDGFSRNSRSRSFHTTPTVSSEASWNSQAGLLKNPPGSLSITVKNFPATEQGKGTASPGRRFFRRRCPCSGKKSVDVEESYSEPKITIRPSLDSTASNQNLIKTEQEMEKATKVKVFPGIQPKEKETFLFSPELTRRTVNSGGFSFPILASSKKKAVEDPARDSLEVFQPTTDGTSSPVLRKSTDFQKNADRRSFNMPGSPKLRSPIDDDLASDASSDLFEIESLSTQINSRRSYSIDELPSLAFEPKKIAGNLPLQRSIEEECYPPSEVSVSWSVTTAEGFDRASAANFSSAVSEFDDHRFQPFSGEGKKAITVGGLLSCRSEKAVCVVAPQLVRFGPDVQRRTGGSLFAVEPDRVLGLARLGAANPVRDSAGLLGPRSVCVNRMVQPINARVY
ncbi:protein PHYTOCHROME KINASE SUBSTRATE 4-like [Phalaenopsis equestris]|uniref:protein PHYTOCHROME KINASE SUBSTRATE 4-like n=1 Tax=Phalaenopsis equestris TaxID=78828 RepID=UPI0009E441CD|nr:protein PHYTOCHROME KINASE SUBSTRATE 4-like [Phalaenopsis equestris]